MSAQKTLLPVPTGQRAGRRPPGGAAKPGRASPMQYDRASTYARMRATRARAYTRSTMAARARPSGRDEGGRRVVRALRRHPVLYGIVALMVISWMAGMATGFDLSFRLVYLLAALVIITYTLSKLGARQISAEVERPLGPFAVGDTYRETVTVRNHGRTPKAWVEVEDKTNIPGMAIRQIGSLGLAVPFSRLEASGTLMQRGEYEIGPLVVRASDPLNLFPQEVEFEGVDKVLVYPRVVRVPDFASPAIYLNRRWFKTAARQHHQHRRLISARVHGGRQCEQDPLALDCACQPIDGQAVRQGLGEPRVGALRSAPRLTGRRVARIHRRVRGHRCGLGRGPLRTVHAADRLLGPRQRSPDDDSRQVQLPDGNDHAANRVEPA